MKVEYGVMVMKDGKAWGIERDEGYATIYGWIDPDDAPIHDPKYCKKVTDITHEGSYLISELKTGKLVNVKRTTVVEVQS